MTPETPDAKVVNGEALSMEPITVSKEEDEFGDFDKAVATSSPDNNLAAADDDFGAFDEAPVAKNESFPPLNTGAQYERLSHVFSNLQSKYEFDSPDDQSGMAADDQPMLKAFIVSTSTRVPYVPYTPLLCIVRFILLT